MEEPTNQDPDAREGFRKASLATRDGLADELRELDPLTSDGIANARRAAEERTLALDGGDPLTYRVRHRRR
jgi:hypothetical protein